MWSDNQSVSGDNGGGAAGGSLADRLSTPVRIEDVKFRTVAGSKVAAYLSSDIVVALANDIFGFAGWSEEIKKMEVDYCVQSTTGQWSTGVWAHMRVYYMVGEPAAGWRRDSGAAKTGAVRPTAAAT